MLDRILKQIPKTDPDLVIGSLTIWVTGFTAEHQRGQGDNAYLSTPTLLVTDNIVALSTMSQTAVFDFRQFLKDLSYMYQNTASNQALEFTPADGEFSLKLTSNDLGHIKITHKFSSRVYKGNLEFEEMIDQSYLPKMIGNVRLILDKEY
jgi:hypothetical protein